jgi:DNA topoisomerase-1
MPIIKTGNKYVNEATNKEIKNVETLEYIKSLRIPPAYKDIVINDKKNKILAYGYDEKGRKQTIYNKWFIEKQRQERFARIIKLNGIFAKIQKHIKKHVKNYSQYPIKKALISLILQIMILCNFRIGCEKYLRENNSYGLTTLEWKHIEFLKNGKVHIKFIGKKGVCNESTLRDKASIVFLKKLAQQQENGHFPVLDKRVFKYLDENGNIHHINAPDVNNYLHKYDPELTCKDIRTAMANYLYIKYYNESSIEVDSKKRQIEAIKKVAYELHNTPAVCKKNYINPAILKF